MTEIEHGSGKPVGTSTAQVLYILHAISPFTLWSLSLLAVIIGAFARSEQLRPMQWLGVALSISGVAVVFAESGLGFSDGRKVLLGNALMVVVALIGAIYSVGARP